MTSLQRGYVWYSFLAKVISWDIVETTVCLKLQVTIHCWLISRYFSIDPFIHNAFYISDYLPVLDYFFRVKHDIYSWQILL